MTVKIIEDSFDVYDKDGGTWLCRVETQFTPGPDSQSQSTFRDEEGFCLFTVKELVDEPEARAMWVIWREGSISGYNRGRRDEHYEIVQTVNELLGVNRICDAIANLMDVVHRLEKK